MMAYKAAASRMIVLPGSSGGIVLPNVRVVVGVVVLLVFLLVGWIGSATTYQNNRTASLRAMARQPLANHSPDGHHNTSV